MNLSIVASRTKFGMESPAVRVEVHISAGLPRFNLVGLPEKAVNESRERVRSAIINSGFVFPYRRVTVNLSPADLPKEGGGGLDLAIALGILAASKQLNPKNLKHYEFMGELALSGEILPMRGFIPAAMAALKCNKAIVISEGNLQEAVLLKNIECYPATFLHEVIAHINGTRKLPIMTATATAQTQSSPPLLTLASVRGQPRAKRALVIAAAGRHNMLMSGPPGSGKTMLAQRLPSLLPPLTDEEYLEVLCIYSLVGKATNSAVVSMSKQPPFRSPHHNATAAALAGGGSNPVPGEISLAHKGVLFLDELPEFARAGLEVLRQPLESGNITIARATKHVMFPADFQLIAAMNPCPCGNLNHPRQECRCTPDRIASYRAKISAPWMDRIDLQVDVPAINYEESFQHLGKGDDGSKNNESNSSNYQQHIKLCEVVSHARQLQLKRAGQLNSRLNVTEIERHCNFAEQSCHDMMQNALEKLGLSLRAIHRTMKVARTIADMDDKEQVSKQHLAEALSYRFSQ